MSISRRNVLTAGIAASAVSALGNAAMAQAPKPATFLLIPGAWHGAWCWRRVEALLVAKGHKVHAISLTGLADRSHLASDAVNMDTHIADIVNFVKWEELNNFVLVGHSYGGMPVVGALESIWDKVSSIVFLDAFVPEDGQSVETIYGLKDLPATGSLKPFPAKAFKINAADEAWLDAQMTPQPVNTETQKMKITEAYKKIAKKTYIRTSQYNSKGFNALYEGFKTQADWKTHLIDSGHDAMLDKPAELAALLEQAI